MKSGSTSFKLQPVGPSSRLLKRLLSRVVPMDRVCGCRLCAGLCMSLFPSPDDDSTNFLVLSLQSRFLRGLTACGAVNFQSGGSRICNCLWFFNISLLIRGLRKLRDAGFGLRTMELLHLNNFMWLSVPNGFVLCCSKWWRTVSVLIPQRPLDHGVRCWRPTLAVWHSPWIQSCWAALTSGFHLLSDQRLVNALEFQGFQCLMASRRSSSRVAGFSRLLGWEGKKKIFYFHPYLGKISNLTNIFQRGWNHQLARCIWGPYNPSRTPPGFSHQPFTCTLVRMWDADDTEQDFKVRWFRRILWQHL